MSKSLRSLVVAAFTVVALMVTPGLASGEVPDRGLTDNYQHSAVTPITGRGLADNYESTGPSDPVAATAPRTDGAREIRVAVVPQGVKVALGALAGMLAAALFAIALMFRQRHANPSV